MESAGTISLYQAIYINITIMIGVGIFINTIPLAHAGSLFTVLGYLIVAILIFPIVLTLSELIKQYPQGGFYTYGKNGINSLIGFLSSWVYFWGKLGTATIGIHIFSVFLQQALPLLQSINTMFLDVFFTLTITYLNTKNTRAGGNIIGTFFVFKMIPLFFVIITGFMYGSLETLSTIPFITETGIESLPLIIFSFLGFEAACFIGLRMENKDAHKASYAITISYALVVILSILYQLMFFMFLGNKILSLDGYQKGFSLLFDVMYPSQNLIKNSLTSFAYSAIASSALSGAYGVFYSLVGNIYTLAKNDLIPYKSYLTWHNKNGMPFLSIILEGAICLFYFIIFSSQIMILQYTASLSCVFAYFISSLSFLNIIRKTKKTIYFYVLALLATIASSILMTVCFITLYYKNWLALLVFILQLTGGIMLFFFNKHNNFLTMKKQ